MKSIITIAALTLAAASAFAGPKEPINRCAGIPGSIEVINPKTGEFEGCRIVRVEKNGLLSMIGMKKGEIVKPSGTQDKSNAHQMDLYNQLETQESDSHE